MLKANSSHGVLYANSFATAILTSVAIMEPLMKMSAAGAMILKREHVLCILILQSKESDWLTPHMSPSVGDRFKSDPPVRSIYGSRTGSVDIRANSF